MQRHLQVCTIPLTDSKEQRRRGTDATVYEKKKKKPISGGAAWAASRYLWSALWCQSPGKNPPPSPNQLTTSFDLPSPAGLIGLAHGLIVVLFDFDPRSRFSCKSRHSCPLLISLELSRLLVDPPFAKLASRKGDMPPRLAGPFCLATRLFWAALGQHGMCMCVWWCVPWILGSQAPSNRGSRSMRGSVTDMDTRIPRRILLAHDSFPRLGAHKTLCVPVCPAVLFFFVVFGPFLEAKFLLHSTFLVPADLSPSHCISQLNQ